VTHDPLMSSVLAEHSDNTEDASHETELDQNNSKQQDTGNTTLQVKHVIKQRNGSSASLASSTQSTERKKRGLFKQLSFNLQYGTFNKESPKVST
jgi:hypothetical protein